MLLRAARSNMQHGHGGAAERTGQRAGPMPERPVRNEAVRAEQVRARRDAAKAGLAEAERANRLVGASRTRRGGGGALRGEGHYMRTLEVVEPGKAACSKKGRAGIKQAREAKQQNPKGGPNERRYHLKDSPHSRVAKEAERERGAERVGPAHS